MLRTVRFLLTLAVIMIALAMLPCAAPAASGTGGVHVLWSNTNGALSLWGYTPSTGSYTQDNYGPFKGWSAQSIADGPDGLTRVLWVNASGAVSIWTLNDATGTYSQNTFGPFNGWTATAMSVGSDNTTHILWTDGGAASVWNYAETTSFTQYTFGPFAGWSAKAIADGPDGLTRVLWVNAGGAASVWKLNGSTGAFTQSTFGPFGGWTAAAVSVNAANTTHLLWNNVSGAASLWNLTGSTGAYTENSFGPFSGWNALTITDGSDGNTQLLWGSTAGAAAIWDVNNATGAYTQHSFGPFANWSATDLTAYNAAAAAIAFPISSHPRLWMTPADLTRLRGWATASNPIWNQGVAVELAQAISNYNTYYFPGGVAANPYPDPGDSQGYTTLYSGTNMPASSEEWAVILALGSLVDPNTANRVTEAKDARNLLMYAMNLAVQGPITGGPFQDPSFPIYNRASATGQDWPLTVDWIYNALDTSGNPILTAADKATIQKVFLLWGNECENAETTGGDHPSPVGVVNNLQLLPNNLPYRMASNNYYLAHARLVTMMGLSLDPGDDPPVNPAEPDSEIGNTVRSYILDGTGAWLYQEYAMMGDPAAVAGAYGIPDNSTGAGFGLASGGLPPEGMLYGESFSYVLGQLFALQTAGFNTPAYSGPQISLIGSPVWNRYVTGYISSLTPQPFVPSSETWLGPIYQFASYGDLLREYVTPNFMQPFALLDLIDHENGLTTHDNAAQWFDINCPNGGSADLLSNVNDPYTWGVIQSLLYFMLIEPNAPTATDPRPTYPTYFYDPGAGRIVAHSDWTDSGTIFDYRASWESINHQDCDGGQFELYRKGEWLTKEMSNYDNNWLGLTVYYHNTLGLQNWCADGTPDLAWFQTGEWDNGSQWNEGQSAGDPSTLVSTSSGYVYATSDLTNLYNLPDVWDTAEGATDITQATRSVLWLSNDSIVVYDRAQSIHSGLFKKFNLSLVTDPVISGTTSTETMADGQQLFIQTLLPASPQITARYAAGDLNPIADQEPTQYVLSVEDPTLPTTTRILNVLEAADPGTARVAATHVQSSTGTAFDGAVFGVYAVYFPVNTPVSLVTTTLSAPAGVTTMLITGLAPNGVYGTSVKAAGTGNTVTLTPGGTGSTADAAGVLVVTI
ncbi:MAG: hypothetical protein ACLQVD_07175 [Capsulimonadaceae bacterium]